MRIARMMITRIPNWSSIATSVKSIQPILRPTVLLQDHTTHSQTSRASAGMRKNTDQATVSGTLTWNLLARSNSRKQAVGLRNADNQTTVLNQTDRLRRGCEIEAFIWLTTEALPRRPVTVNCVAELKLLPGDPPPFAAARC